jgi:alkanesulfonate monooxygenase SsuD/methylene tetrahydromethanopterin reductase-like flavin-dependent oxidoreductase (luciferase family)
VKIGLNYAPIRRKDQPRAAVLADQLGYSSLWYGEHVALPFDFDPSKYPGESMMFDPESIILDPFALSPSWPASPSTYGWAAVSRSSRSTTH